MNSKSYFPLAKTPLEWMQIRKESRIHLRPFMLKGFPSDDVSYHVEAPSSEPSEVYVC